MHLALVWSNRKHLAASVTLWPYTRTSAILRCVVGIVENNVGYTSVDESCALPSSVKVDNQSEPRFLLDSATCVLSNGHSWSGIVIAIELARVQRRTAWVVKA